MQRTPGSRVTNHKLLKSKPGKKVNTFAALSFSFYSTPKTVGNLFLRSLKPEIKIFPCVWDVPIFGGTLLLEVILMEKCCFRKFTWVCLMSVKYTFPGSLNFDNFWKNIQWNHHPPVFLALFPLFFLILGWYVNRQQGKILNLVFLTLFDVLPKILAFTTSLELFIHKRIHHSSLWNESINI